MSSRFNKTTGGFDDSLELSISKIEALLKGNYKISKRSIAILLMQQDKEIEKAVIEKELQDNYSQIRGIIEETASLCSEPLSYIIAIRRSNDASRIANRAISFGKSMDISFLERLSRLTTNPITGFPILIIVLYFGLYKFVGEFGAGFLVHILEKKVFQDFLNPLFSRIFAVLIPWEVLRNLFVGEFGIVTLGIRYAIAIILPVVATFFLAFAVIEDTGYLPRLALLIDRSFKKIGLSGRAVIPMVLGFGCDTMATMVTRTLTTKREKIIATLLLALAIPCSAQLGVILALLHESIVSLLIWIFVLILVFMLVGFLAAVILPGEGPTFYMEIPPLRLPKISNILIKTYTRLEWYLKEVFPMFILASVLIWLGQVTGIFNYLIKILELPVRLIGLPPKTAVVFLLGFFRRDYGTAGLYDMKEGGDISGTQLLVAAITLTLFLPCIAQFLINIKERGLRIGIAISVFVLLFSFSVGYLINLIFTVFKIHL